MSVCTLHRAQCTMNVYTLYRVKSPFHSVECIYVHCKQHCVKQTEVTLYAYIVQSAVYIEQCLLYIHKMVLFSKLLHTVKNTVLCVVALYSL